MVSDLASRKGLQPSSLVNLGEERCPLCKQALPHDLNVKELQARLDESRSEATRTEAKRLRAEFEKERAVAVEGTKKQLTVLYLKREQEIRSEAKAQALGEVKNELQAAKAARAKAENDKRVAEDQARQLKARQNELVKTETAKALQNQRAALEKEKTDALHRAQAQGFEKNQKLEKQVDALKRQLEQKSAAELGEGAEIDLYESLREHFEGDKIRRIKKGQPGADIMHEVVQHGRVCGSILYDSKNHRAWRNDFVEKLKTDQLAAKADHAILTTSVFPSGAQQICVQGDVIIANPARVVDLVTIVRAQIVQAHRLRLGAEERVRKTEALYEFINSGRCQQLMTRYEAIAEGLLELEEKEVEGHKRTWERRGKLIRDAQKVHANLRAEIDRIIEGRDSL